VVNEIAGEGTADRVAASVSYALSANADVELLETATQSGTGGINLTGSSIANTINGNDGANVLDGKGGNDILTGFGGADTFQFTTALGASNVDTIVGFVSGADKIALDDAIFAAIGPVGALNANAFFAGTAAHDADDRIIYNQATGALLYDADGNGAGAAVQFATLSGNPVLAASDFLVI
jgi:serralysin